jgi:hypothetical protein
VHQLARQFLPAPHHYEFCLRASFLGLAVRPFLLTPSEPLDGRARDHNT